MFRSSHLLRDVGVFFESVTVVGIPLCYIVVCANANVVLACERAVLALSQLYLDLPAK